MTATLRDRWTALTARERGFLAAGGIVLLAFLLVLMVSGRDEEAPGVELAPGPPPVATPPATFAPPPPAPAAVAPAASPAGFVLRGVFGGGPGGGAAILAFPDGAQRHVRVGREFLPGVTLRDVGLAHAVIESGGSLTRLELDRPGADSVGAAPPAPAPPPAPQGETRGLRT